MLPVTLVYFFIILLMVVIKVDVLIGTTEMCVWIVPLFACGGYIVLGTFSTSGIEICALCVYGLAVKACTRELVKWL